MGCRATAGEKDGIQIMNRFEKIASRVAARERKASVEWYIKVNMDETEGTVNGDIDGDFIGVAYDTERSDEFERGMTQLVKKFKRDVEKLMSKVEG